MSVAAARRTREEGRKRRDASAGARATMCLALLALALCLSHGEANEAQLDAAGIRVTSGDEAQVSLEQIGKFQVKALVAPAGGGKTGELEVEVAETGPKTWPAEDLHVLDTTGQAVPIRRNGVEWHRFTMAVPAVGGSYLVTATRPPDAAGRVPVLAESERTVTDATTGIRASVCKWYDGKDAALSIRFDDSHPTHLDVAVPILREHGLRATFMVNPGRPEYLERRNEWEACARQGEHEFANHTMNHRGASTEGEIEREVGAATEYLWQLFPNRSRLLALNRGGGTQWVTRKPFRHYLDKYHLFNVSGSLGMDDVYGKRVEALERHVLNAIERGGWAKIHYHSLGDGLATSEANFQAAMELIAKHASRLWIAGLADVYKYHTERRAASIALTQPADDRLELTLSCGTDPELYDQPLTIKLDVPTAWSAARVSMVEEDGPTTECEAERGQGFVRFRAPPVNGGYLFRR